MKAQAIAECDRLIARLCGQFLSEFESTYVESLPMIDVKFTKENAQSYHLWGLLSDSWKPSPECGVAVFLQGLEKRGARQSSKTDLYVRRDTRLV